MVSTDQDARATEVRVVALVSTGHFFSHFYLLVLPPLFPLLKAEFGVSYTALGAILTAFSVTSGAAQFPVGVLVDRVGARHLLIGGLALVGTAFALMSLTESYVALVALALLAGLGNSVFHPADYTILGARVRPRRLGRAFSIHTFAGHMGWAVAPPVVIFLAGIFDWRAAVGLVGLVGLAAALVLLAQSAVLRGDHLPHRHAGRAAGRGLWASVGLLTSPPILLMFLFFVMTSAIQGGVQGFTPAALGALHGTSLMEAGSALTAFLVGGATGVLTGGIVADRVRRLDLVAAVGFFAAAAALSLIALAALPLAVLVGVFAFAGFMLGLIAPSRDLMVRSVTPEGASGKVFGFVSTGLDVGGALGPLFFGWLLDRHVPEGVFLAAAAMMMVSLSAALLASRFRPRAAGPAPAE